VRDILSDLKRWSQDGNPIGLATVVGVYQSAPRQPGASMALSPDGTVSGSVSGGCVEGAVVEVAGRVLETGTPELVRYGISDDDAFSVGLTCGGQIDIFVERVGQPSWIPDVAREVEAGRPIAIATILSAPDGATVRPGAKMLVTPETTSGTLGAGGLDAAVTDDARGFLSQGATALRRYGTNGERRLEDVLVFIESLAPRPRMIVFGAIDFASAVARIGTFLGYHVTVCDARATFATNARFPQAHEVVVAWPHRYLAETRIDERTVLAVLTHDPKFDVPLLEVALRTPAAYIGAMGSRRTHDDRLARLRERGLTDEELARLRSPIGLDIGARTPEETAVSVAAEIIALHWGGTGQPLSVTEGAIHHADALVSG
jgi:xanthine dehydrogenase accessory factor